MEETIKDIQRILADNNFHTNEDIAQVVQRTIEQKENNVRFTCIDVNGKEYIVKYSIINLTKLDQYQGIRAKLTLANEANFYIQTDPIRKEHIIIPKLLAHSAEEENPWIIIEKLDLDQITIFPSGYQFKKESYPDFFAKTIIDGISEFQQFSVDKSLFITQDWQKVYDWLASLDHPYEQLSFTKMNVLELFKKTEDVFIQNTKYISHNDIVPDTMGYDKQTKKLVLLDFEKVQITHQAFDYASICSNPLVPDWIELFEKELSDKYPSSDFMILYTMSCLLRTLVNLNNFISGRIDHVFENMLGKEELNHIRPEFITLWAKQAETYKEKLASLV